MAHPKIWTNGDGYEIISTDEGSYRLHRLVAAAEHGVEAIKNKDVHHKEIEGGSIPWLNIGSMVEPMDSMEHRKGHLGL